MTTSCPSLRFTRKRITISRSCRGSLNFRETVSPSPALNELLVSRETSPISTGFKLGELIRRPQISYQDLAPFDPERPDLPAAVAEEAEILLKYEGYIKKQQMEVE